MIHFTYSSTGSIHDYISVTTSKNGVYRLSPKRSSVLPETSEKRMIFYIIIQDMHSENRSDQLEFWKLWFALFLLSMGSSLPSNFLIFFANEPKLVIPNLPNISGGWSLYGRPSQFPLGLEIIPENLSSSLSQEIHLICFFVRSASFSFY